MAYPIVTDRKGLINKLKLIADYCTLMENNHDYIIVMDAIQVIEELIYLNDCYCEDVEMLTKRVNELENMMKPELERMAEEKSKADFDRYEKKFKEQTRRRRK